MTANIVKLYNDAGFAVPTGKGIHTYLFHRCVVNIKKKIRAGKMKKRSNPYAMCMGQLGAAKAVKASHRE